VRKALTHAQKLTGRQTDGYDEANVRFSRICKRA